MNVKWTAIADQISDALRIDVFSLVSNRQLVELTQCVAPSLIKRSASVRPDSLATPKSNANKVKKNLKNRNFYFF